jgi:hypothetical protein
MTEEELISWCENNGGHDITIYGYSYGLELYDKTFIDGKVCQKCPFREERVIESKGLYIGPIIIPNITLY